MRFLKSVKNELFKIFYVRLFALSAIGINLLALFSDGVTDNNNKSHTIIDIIFHIKKYDVKTDSGLNSFTMLNKGFGAWTVMILPLVLGFSYLYVLTAERKNGNVRMMIQREGNICYCLSKMISLMIYGGVLLTFSFGCFYVIVSRFFYSPFTMFPDYAIQLYGKEAVYLIKRFAGIFLYGMSVNVFVYGFAALFSDRYVVYSLPFVFSYLVKQVNTKLLYKSFEKGNNNMIEILSVFNMENIMYFNGSKYWKYNLILVLLCYLGLLWLFYSILKKRYDSCDWR